jgi:hypothetical protein
MAEERPGRLIALRRELRRLTRKHPGAWAGFGTMFLAALLIVAGLSGAGSGPKRVSPNVSPPPGMGAVVGGIQACYDSGPPPGGYPWVAGTVALYAVGDKGFVKPIATGTAAPNADFVILAPPGDYELAPYAGLSNPAVSVTVWSGHTTFQDLPSTGGCI